MAILQFLNFVLYCPCVYDAHYSQDYTYLFRKIISKIIGLKVQGLFIHSFSIFLIAVIPLGLMHDAHYSQNVPKYLNVGSLGLTLAHEILHTLDQMGRGFDANGTKRVSSANKSLLG